MEESALVEQLFSEAAYPCLPSPAGSVQVLDDLVEEIEQWSLHSEPVYKLQEILLEAPLNDSYKETLD